jgi:hypothetical protein
MVRDSRPHWPAEVLFFCLAYEEIINAIGDVENAGAFNHMLEKQPTVFGRSSRHCCALSRLTEEVEDLASLRYENKSCKAIKKKGIPSIMYDIGRGLVDELKTGFDSHSPRKHFLRVTAIPS